MKIDTLREKIMLIPNIICAIPEYEPLIRNAALKSRVKAIVLKIIIIKIMV